MIGGNPVIGKTALTKEIRVQPQGGGILVRCLTDQHPPTGQIQPSPLRHPIRLYRALQPQVGGWLAGLGGLCGETDGAAGSSLQLTVAFEPATGTGIDPAARFQNQSLLLRRQAHRTAIRCRDTGIRPGVVDLIAGHRKKCLFAQYQPARTRHGNPIDIEAYGGHVDGTGGDVQGTVDGETRCGQSQRTQGRQMQ